MVNPAAVLLNTNDPRLGASPRKTAAVSALQSSNALSPMLVTLEGIVTLVSALQFANAL